MCSDKPMWKPSYCWRADWDEAVSFLVQIEPWVRIKKEQIYCARMWDAVRNRKKKREDQEHYEMIELLVQQLQWLNRKGKRQEDDEEPIEKTLATLPVSVEQILQEVGYATH